MSAVLWLAACASTMAAEPLPVTSFETAGELRRWQGTLGSATIERVDRNATHGVYSACLTFRPGPARYSGFKVDLRGADDRPMDWSGGRSLSFDVFNPWEPGPDRKRWTGALDVSLVDVLGHKWWHRCMVSRWLSQQHFDVPLVATMDRESTHGVDFDFRGVVGFSLYTHTPDHDVTLFVDRVCVVPASPVESVPHTGQAEDRPATTRQLSTDACVFVQHCEPDYPYEERGLFELGRGPVLLRLTQPGLVTRAAELPELVEQARALKRQGICFHVVLFNFWYGKYEMYEEATARLRKAVAAVKAEGGDCFQAVWLHEMSAITRYQQIREQPTRLAKADAYVSLLRRFIRDIEVPGDVLVLSNQDHFVNYALDFEAGVDAVLPETLFNMDNVELSVAQARGMAGSFGRWWGGDTARYSSPLTTARYQRDGSTQAVKIDLGWWPPSEVLKAFVQHYYNGANVIRGQSEHPAIRPDDEALMRRFLRFVKQYPRGDEVVCRIAVARGDGDCWAGANMHGNTQGLADWRSEAWTEERDFAYLDVLFPGFSADGFTVDAMWTGTPFGPVDIVSPAMPLATLKRYDVLIVLGFHRVDALRAGWLADLRAYAAGGGTVLLAADALRTGLGAFPPAEHLEPLIGARIADACEPLSGPIHVVSSALALPRTAYDLAEMGTPAVSYSVEPTSDEVVTRDANDRAVLFVNAVGKGRVFWFAVPGMASLPPAGHNALVRDVVAAVSGCSRWAVSPDPPSPCLETVLSRSSSGRAVVFLMNHDGSDWEGRVSVNLDDVGFEANAPSNVLAVCCRGDEETHPAVRAVVVDGRLTLGPVRLAGRTDDFDPWHAASFAVLTIQSSP